MQGPGFNPWNHTNQNNDNNNQKMARVGKEIEKLEAQYTVSRNVKWNSSYRNTMEVPQ
jgi:hypothetical protein